MPFVSSVEGSFGYGRGLVIPNNYYTSSSGFYMMGQNTQSLRIADLSGTAIIRTYTGITNISRTFIHDKDLNSNIYYTMTFSTANVSVYKNVIPKGGIAVTQTLINSVAITTTGTYGGQCYVTNAISSIPNGGILFTITGGLNGFIGTVVFDSNKSVSSVYVLMTMPRINSTYYQYTAVEIVPQVYSGFNNNHMICVFSNITPGGIAFIGNKVVQFNGSVIGNPNYFQITNDVNAPVITYSMIYYPPNKPIFTGDTINLSMNRVVIFDNNSVNAYEWQIEENGTTLTWTFLRKLVTANNNNYPYSMSTGAYQSIA